MRLSKKQIIELQNLLHKQTGTYYSNEETQAAGLAIVKFIIAKYRHGSLPDKEKI